MKVSTSSIVLSAIIVVAVTTSIMAVVQRRQHAVAEVERTALQEQVDALEAQVDVLQQHTSADAPTEPAQDTEASTEPINMEIKEPIDTTEPSSDTNPVPATAVAPPVDTNIGYINDIYEGGDSYYIDVDYIQWLSASDGTCTSGQETATLPQCNPNGFLIVNENPLIRTFEVSASVAIAMQTYGDGTCTLQPDETISFETFYDLWGANATCTNARTAPYVLEVNGGIVESITEQYLP